MTSPTLVGEASSFPHLLRAPYETYVARAAELTERAELVKALSPELLVEQIRAGVNDALSKYGPQLRPPTSNLIGLWLRQHTQLAEKLKPQWARLQGAASGDILRVFKAGLFSEQASVGGTVGGALGAWGAVAGRLLGGFIALQQDNVDEAELLKVYLAEVDRWHAVLISDLELRVLPQIERDVNPWPHRLRSTLSALVTLAIGAAAYWFLR